MLTPSLSETSSPAELTKQEYAQLGLFFIKLHALGQVKGREEMPESASARHFIETGHRLAFGCCRSSLQPVPDVAEDDHQPSQ